MVPQGDHDEFYSFRTASKLAATCALRSINHSAELRRQIQHLGAVALRVPDRIVGSAVKGDDQIGA